MPRLATACAVCLLALVAPASATVTKIGKCRVPGRATIERKSRAAVVWSVARSAAQGGDDPNYDRNYFGCMRGVGDRVPIAEGGGDITDQHALSGFRLAGRFTAYIESRADSTDHHSEVRVFNLRARRRKWSAYPGTPDRPWQEEPGIVALVVAPDGAVGYLLYGPALVDGHTTSWHEVWKRDADGQAKWDAGVYLDSLRRRGQVVTWWHDGEERSAELR